LPDKETDLFGEWQICTARRSSLTLNIGKYVFPTGRCRYFDRFYSEGQAIVPDENCHYQCKCHVSEYFEGFLCEPLCPVYIDQECGPGRVNKPKIVPAGPPEFGCMCSELNCVPFFGIEALRQL